MKRKELDCPKNITSLLSKTLISKEVNVTMNVLSSVECTCNEKHIYE